MIGYAYGKKKRRLPQRILLLLAGLIVLLIVGVLITRHIYYVDLEPVSANPKTQIFTVEKGSSVKQIAADLQDNHLIRSAWAFQLYVHSHELTDKLQAGTYALSPNQDTPSIVTTMTKGRIATHLVTIYPGRRIDQVRADLINDGFSPAVVEQALDPAQYSNLPALAFKPAGVNTLEGLLIEMGRHLTPGVQAAFAAENLTTYQGLTLASMVEQEVDKPTDRPQVAQVFLSRLKGGSALGSDVTARYGAIAAGRAPSLSYDSPYNTLLHTGLPPSPISTISAGSLTAAIHPAATHWLYFVTGDNGTTYFSTNLRDHQALSAKYCHKLCGR